VPPSARTSAIARSTADAAALRLLDDGLLVAARHLAPVCDLYRRRIAQFQIEGPPQNWDGVFTAEEK
jgi:hypothetical protein